MASLEQSLPPVPIRQVSLTAKINSSGTTSETSPCLPCTDEAPGDTSMDDGEDAIIQHFAQHHKQTSLPHIPRAIVIRKTLIAKAQRILDNVNYQFGNGDLYLDEVYGNKISLTEAQVAFRTYMQREGLLDKINVQWRSDISCSASLACVHGAGYRRRDGVTHTLRINSDPLKNSFLRKYAICALADHELGTHYIRSHNDSFQVWHYKRSKFGLRHRCTYQMLTTEEGLATLNTHHSLSCKYLWWPALLYFACYMSHLLEAPQLYRLLSKYITDVNLRTKIVFRAKRTLKFDKREETDQKSSATVQCCGWDQCYLVGAAKLLRKLEAISFPVLYSGKIALGDLEKVRLKARTTVTKTPRFLNGIQSLGLYKKALREIRSVNDL